MAIVGTGVIGAGWASRALSKGLDVRAYDPHPEGEAQPSRRHRQCLAGPRARRSRTRRLAGPPHLLHVYRGVRRRRRLHPGERPGAGGAEAEAAGRDRRRRWPRRHHRLLDLGPPADAACGEVQAPRALRHRPSLQPGLSPAAGRGHRRREDLGRDDRAHARASTRRSACARSTSSARSRASSPTA